MKKVFTLVCCAALWMAAVGSVSCSLPKRGSDSVFFDYFWWEDDQSYYIKGTNVAGKTTDDRWDMIDVVIPTEHNGHPVTVIGWDSFKNCQILRSVTIPEGISGIHGGTFFNCDSLETVHLPKSMENFHGSSFAGCNALREVTVDPENPWLCSVDGVVYTKDQRELIFYPPGRTDEEFAIPEGVESVDRYAFAYCENLKRICFPQTVCENSYESILFCQGMEGVTVDERNETYRSIDGNLYSKDGKTLVRLCVSTENVSLTVPEGVTTVAEGAAYYAHNVTAVTFPDSLTHIERCAFQFCDALESVTLPAGLVYIGPSAFSGCEQLIGAVFQTPSGWSVIPQGGKFQDTKTLREADLAAPATAAEYLTDAYDGREWKRGE